MSIRVPFETVKETVKKALLCAGLSQEQAETCATIHTQSSADGVESHGLNRIPRFVEYIQKGWINLEGSPVKAGGFGAVENYDGQMGIGIINAKEVYGWSSVKPEADLDLIVKLEFWDENKFYDRLGIDTEYEEIMGVKIPCITIPVRPGRNLAVIIELATLNNRQKKMGNNAAQTLEDAMGQMFGG